MGLERAREKMKHSKTKHYFGFFCAMNNLQRILYNLCHLRRTKEKFNLLCVQCPIITSIPRYVMLFNFFYIKKKQVTLLIYLQFTLLQTHAATLTVVKFSCFEMIEANVYELIILLLDGHALLLAHSNQSLI